MALTGLPSALGLAPEAPSEGRAQGLVDLQLLPLREREDTSEKRLALNVLLALVGAITRPGHITYLRPRVDGPSGPEA